MLAPPDFKEEQGYLLTADGARKLDIGAANDLSGKEIIDWYPSESGALALVLAGESSQGGTSANSGPRHYYVVTFGTDGAYKSQVKIDASFTPSKIAGFDSGILLAYGADRNTDQPTLALLKQDGSVLRYLQLDTSVRNWYASKTDSNESASRSPITLPSGQLTPYSDSVLLVSQGSTLPVFAIREDGSIRAVRVAIPDGYTLDSIITRPQQWYVRFRARPLEAERTTSDAPSPLFEVNPEEGTLIERLSPVGVRADEVACFQRGNLIAFRRGADGKLIGMSAGLQ